MTIRQSSRFVIAALALGVVAAPTDAFAQADVRDLRPAMILMVDTSGSMERLPDCECTTSSCSECLPQCSGTPGSGDDRNRWATVLEALTGSWNDSVFACSAVNRASFGGDDATYPLPHFTNPGATGQNQDGILDTYAARAKFALMTFDGVPTLINGPELVPVVDYATYATQMRTALGGYSYGNVMETPWSTQSPAAPSYPFLFPNCSEAQGYFINVGAKRAVTGSETLADIPGALLTVGADSDYLSVNSAIQSSLLAVRPSGPTPIAGMLEDLRHYLANDAAIGPVSGGGGDPYYSCRKRYGLLITDGYPNADMRGAPFHCETATSPGGYPTGRSSWCPYDLPQQIAAQLCSPSGSPYECADSAPLDGLFVVGFNVADADAVDVLTAIAVQGGTEHAYFATDLDSLRDAIAEIINVAATGTTSRTTPAFTTPSLGASSQSASQFSTGFLIDDPSEPWTGVLERTRFECSAATNTATRQTITDDDRFHTILNANANRRLLTVVPAPANVAGHLIGTSNGVSPLSSVSISGANAGGAGTDGAGGVSCENGSVGAGTPTPAVGTEDDLVLEDFELSNANLGRAHFGVATDDERNAIIEWVRGDNNARSTRLGDIYHSSPVVVGPPGTDISDESFNEYRRSPVVANRPTVVYVGSNDGVLHAFAAEDMTIADGPYANDVITAGQELWGFVPPAVFTRLNAARSSHQWLVDGTPVVKDVFYRRTPQGASTPEAYHTVLIVGLRGGGGAYIALDVTDPFEPKFLWQFAHADLGETYGTPALGQAVVEVSTNVYEERAVAFLPGGGGDDITLSCSGMEPVSNAPDRLAGCLPNGRLVPDTATGSIDARARVRCWRERGRAMFVVDPSTGQLIKYLDDRVFSSPITGGVALFTGNVGTIASRAYFNDADGVIWRMEFSSADLDEWRASPVFDMFHGAGGAQGQPSYGPPVLSTDLDGNVVIIQGTGDVDTLDGDSTVTNRITSVTDVATFSGSGSGAASYGVNLNWEVVLAPGEVVTGPIQLFDSKIYFATFRSAASTTDACAFGRSYLWGLDYRLPSSGYAPTGILPAGPAPSTTTVANIAQADNELILGLAVTQDLTCADWNDESRFDPYVPSASANVRRAGQVNRGGFRLVGQVSGGETTSGAVQELSYDLTAPVSATRIQGWAGHAD